MSWTAKKYTFFFSKKYSNSYFISRISITSTMWKHRKQQPTQRAKGKHGGKRTKPDQLFYFIPKKKSTSTCHKYKTSHFLLSSKLNYCYNISIGSVELQKYLFPSCNYFGSIILTVIISRTPEDVTYNGNWIVIPHAVLLNWSLNRYKKITGHQ